MGSGTRRERAGAYPRRIGAPQNPARNARRPAASARRSRSTQAAGRRRKPLRDRPDRGAARGERARAGALQGARPGVDFQSARPFRRGGCEMKIEQAAWLNEHYEFSLEELCELSGLSEAELRELVDHGVLAPIEPGARAWAFRADRLVVARSARRLRKDLDLDPHGVALVVALLERVRDLEAELRDLQAKLPRRQRLTASPQGTNRLAPCPPRARGAAVLPPRGTR